MSGETLSTVAILDALRTRLLNTPSPAAPNRKLSDVIGARLYIGAPPADATYPYGILRWTGDRTSPAHRAIRKRGILELTVVARPADEVYAKAVEEGADLAQGALTLFKVGDTAPATSGAILVVASSRDTLPRPVDPVDQQTYTIYLTWEIVIWPKFLSQYTS